MNNDNTVVVYEVYERENAFSSVCYWILNGILIKIGMKVST